MEEHPYRTGATALTLASLLPSGEEYEGYEVPESTFGKDAGEAEFIKKDPRTVREDLTDEEADLLASEGGDYGFFSASDGGIVSLYPGGSPSYHGPHNIGGHPAAISRQQQSIPRKPDRPSTPIPPELIAESAAPFQTRLSSFNVDDILSKIGGSSSPESIFDTSRVPLNIPQQTSAPIDNAALSSLLQRASNLPAVQPVIQTSADGGSIQLATGGEFEGRVQGQGDGMSDQIAFNVVPQTPADIPNTPDVALLSTDEYVVPADVVSMLGNGSSTAGSKMLDHFNQTMRQKAHGTNKQQTPINAGRELSRLT